MDARSGDPVVAAVLGEAQADADTVGLLLAGSRGAGQADAQSDYDFVWVLSDLAYQDRAERGGPWDVARRIGGHKVELSFASPAVLRELAERPSWRNSDYATAVVLLDRGGELGRLVEGRPEAAPRPPRRSPPRSSSRCRSPGAVPRPDPVGGRRRAIGLAGRLTIGTHRSSPGGAAPRPTAATGAADGSCSTATGQARPWRRIGTRSPTARRMLRYSIIFT